MYVSCDCVLLAAVETYLGLNKHKDVKKIDRTFFKLQFISMQRRQAQFST
jgi:hypothetical protein